MSNTVTFIGNGKMAIAIAQGLAKTHAIEVIGRSDTALNSFENTVGVSVKKTLYPDADITGKTAILCVKPYNVAEIAPYLKGSARVLYSVLAGTSLESLKAIRAERYVRAMPNLAAEVNHSMTSLVGDLDLRTEAIELFSVIGKALWLSNEKELDIATALAGSGPAYLALIAESLCDGAVREGLKRDDAMELMRGLFKGFGELIQTIHPALLKDGVMSPGGTTAAGYGALEKSGVREGCMEAVRFAHEKAKGMR